MSGAVTSVPVKQQLVRRGRIVALALVGLAAAVLVALVLADSGDDTPTAGSGQPAAVQSTVQPAPPVAAIRYDGGPEEGAVGTVTPPVYVNPSTGYATPRYDGGTKEGAAGTVTPPVDVNPSTGYATPRYDGGPDEGTRGPSATAP
jgi:hypothetical protein